MKASYKRLWKLLIDKDLKKLELSKMAHVSAASLTKLTKGENVNMDILIRICTALDCELGDIVELIPDDEPDDSGKIHLNEYSNHE